MIDSGTFANPVQMREFCMDVESKYRESVIPGSVIAGDISKYPQSLLAQLDDASGFHRIGKSIALQHRNEPRQEVEKLIETARIKHLHATNLAFRVVSWDGLNHKNRYISITKANFRPLLPTQLAMWMSLLAHRTGKIVKLQQEEPIWRTVSLQFNHEVDRLQEARVNDVIEFRATVAYKPELSDRISLATETYRLACLNLSQFSSDRMLNAIRLNHDLGSVRSRLEKLVMENIQKLSATEKQLQFLMNSEQPRNDLISEFMHWPDLLRQSLPAINAVLMELRNLPEVVSRYDVFNAITTARHHLAEKDSHKTDCLERLAGAYARSFSENFNVWQLT